jgi:hypothetical protein
MTTKLFLHSDLLLPIGLESVTMANAVDTDITTM